MSEAKNKCHIESPEDKGQTKKQQKLGGFEGEGDSKRIPNPSPCLDFKLHDGESWERTWCGVTEPRPKWGKVRMCARWNIRQYCFKNCRNKESHVPCDKIPPSKKAEFKKWMATVRGAANSDEPQEG